MTPLGTALRLLPRRVLDVEDLVEAARDLCATGPAGVHLVLDEDDPRHPTLRVEEDERSCSVDLLELAQVIAGSRTGTGPDDLAAALRGWLDERPVTDAEAARRGIAVLAWSPVADDRLTWQVAVRRATGLVAWAPHPFTSAGDVLATRAAAWARAADVVVRCTVEGPVLLLDADEPHLATAALAAPEQVLARAAALGLPLGDGSVVITPGRPVAWANRGVSGRLAGETSEPCAVLPWREVADLPWA
ncbi:hypothetical protein SAMN03159343_0376 [Klenkia marina]|uniref:Uncharacterized protein n=1 Tax=Klenkia marina TaxID=1960309 RepID=A0A1G4XCB9_9ACTN|nr:hypothetical protein [Klenkia marina]SCX38318.1 hypothetical protein SAMN03159343_0376 [Klenkia marina]